MSDRKSSVLYVDDEPQNLLTFRYALEDRFSVLTARSGEQALEVLAAQDVGVLVCDQRMPEMTGVEVCARARELRPDVVRIIMTAYSDVQAAMDAINRGHVFRYLTKPWRAEELSAVLDQALDLVRMRRTIAALQERVLRGSEPPMLEGVLRQVAAELDAPVARLEMGSEQVGDLLEAGLGAIDDPDRVRELVEHARDVHNDSERPVAELRAVVRRLERGQRLVPLPPPRSCDVGRVARAAVHVARAALDPSVKLRLSLGAAPAAGIDAVDLGQALLHLINQAGQLALESSERLIEVDVREDAAGVQLRVSSFGPEVASQKLARAFDPHFALGAFPPGVGLALVKQLVERAGGSVLVEAVPGGGVSFVLLLPVTSTLAIG